MITTGTTTSSAITPVRILLRSLITTCCGSVRVRIEGCSAEPPISMKVSMNMVSSGVDRDVRELAVAHREQQVADEQRAGRDDQQPQRGLPGAAGQRQLDHQDEQHRVDDREERVGDLERPTAPSWRIAGSIRKVQSMKAAASADQQRVDPGRVVVGGPAPAQHAGEGQSPMNRYAARANASGSRTIAAGR